MNTHMKAKTPALLDQSPTQSLLEPVSVLFFVLGLVLAATLMHSMIRFKSPRCDHGIVARVIPHASAFGLSYAH
jgi:hypothetical protein